MKRSLFFCGALLLIGTLSGAVYEAEDHVADPASAAAIARQDASGGRCVRLSKGSPQAAKPAVSRREQKPAQAPLRQPQETSKQKNFELVVPDFIQNRSKEIPPLTMHMDDGTTIPPFRPKG